MALIRNVGGERLLCFIDNFTQLHSTLTICQIHNYVEFYVLSIDFYVLWFDLSQYFYAFCHRIFFSPFYLNINFNIYELFMPLFLSLFFFSLCLNINFYVSIYVFCDLCLKFITFVCVFVIEYLSFIMNFMLLNRCWAVFAVALDKYWAKCY